MKLLHWVKRILSIERNRRSKSCHLTCFMKRCQCGNNYNNSFIFPMHNFQCTYSYRNVGVNLVEYKYIYRKSVACEFR